MLIISLLLLLLLLFFFFIKADHFIMLYIYDTSFMSISYSLGPVFYFPPLI